MRFALEVFSYWPRFFLLPMCKLKLAIAARVNAIRESSGLSFAGLAAAPPMRKLALGGQEPTNNPGALADNGARAERGH